MKLNGTLALTGAALVCGMLAPTYATAASCALTVTLPATCTGTLTAESGSANSIVVASFTLTQPSAVTLFTTSYGGGMNLNGSTSSAGGFQPNLTLFSPTGFAVAFENGSYSPIANPDPSNGWRGDGYVKDSDVTPGTYFAIMTDVNNQVSAAFTGFGSTTPANFYTLFSSGGMTTFMDAQGNTRNGNYAFNIEATPLSPAAAPEPASVWLVLPALLGAGLFLRKRRTSLS